MNKLIRDAMEKLSDLCEEEGAAYIIGVQDEEQNVGVSFSGGPATCIGLTEIVRIQASRNMGSVEMDEGMN